jgi:hypothetical protein
MRKFKTVLRTWRNWNVLLYVYVLESLAVCLECSLVIDEIVALLHIMTATGWRVVCSARGRVWQFGDRLCPSLGEVLGNKLSVDESNQRCARRS